MKNYPVLILATCLLLVFTLPTSAQDLVIIHTNDFHSQIEPFTTGRHAGAGGLKSLSGYLEETRKEHPDVLYLDAGDYNQGTLISTCLTAR